MCEPLSQQCEKCKMWFVVEETVEHPVCPKCAPPIDAEFDRMHKWFDFGHLKPPLQDVSKQFSALAFWITQHIDPGPERTVALRKLLESKDAAVRATVHPGG